MTQEVKNIFEILNRLAELSLYRDNEVVFIGKTKHKVLGDCVTYSLYAHGKPLCLEVPFPVDIEKWTVKHVAVVLSTANAYVSHNSDRQSGKMDSMTMEILNNILVSLMKNLAAAEIPQYEMVINQYPVTGDAIGLLNRERDLNRDFEEFRSFNMENYGLINPDMTTIEDFEKTHHCANILKTRNFEHSTLTAGEF